MRGDVIHCKIHTANPHYSHHAHGENRHRVNVVATVTCTKPVAQLSERVGLYKNGTIYKRSGVATVAGKKFVKQNASRRCVKNKNYAGYAKASVLFPPGYSPRTAKLSDKSPTVKISKCKKK
ncbi:MULTISPECIES: hypothetical protein [Streptomyces]|uniref:Uncharacterized protein n=1 Tax=Streptomyces ramulosus TaxID=47762 RepID=A0ABW1FCD1_9ACTN